MEKWLNYVSKRNAIVALVLIASICWVNSITSEYCGYDDITLLATNPRIQNGIAPAAKFYIEHPSLSRNIAWNPNPNYIYRPLEFVGSAIGFSLWGINPTASHFFFNFSIHIFNTLLIFFILLKALAADEHRDKILKAFAITALWCVHPLHCEAVNMLTSGTGFLLGTCFMLTAIAINLYSSNLILIAISFLSFLLAYLGSEMAILGPLYLILIFIYQKHLSQTKLKSAIALFSIFAYLKYRSSILTEDHMLVSDLSYRVFVTAPQIFLHYLKLFIYPQILSVDQHRHVILGEAWSSNHLISLSVVGILFLAFLYYLRQKSSSSIVLSIVAMVLSLSMVLHIIPLYVYARERYCYIFVLATYLLIFALINQYFKNKVLFIVLFLVVLITSSTRSIIRNNDWQNGEKLWTATIASSGSDIGIQQLWRGSLVNYYLNPGTKTFVANPSLKTQTLNDYNQFINKNDLINVKAKGQEAINISAALSDMATRLTRQEQTPLLIAVLTLARKYNPNNIGACIHLIEKRNIDDALTDELVSIADKASETNSFYALALLKALTRSHSKYHDPLAEKYSKLYPNNIDIVIHHYNALFLQKKYTDAYILAKSIEKKYHEDNTISNFIQAYEKANPTMGIII